MCGIIAMLLNFAYFQREYRLIAKGNYYNDALDSILMLVFGFVSLIVVFIVCGTKHGLLIPYSKKSKIESGLL
jgi:uncharacterized membrane protein